MSVCWGMASSKSEVEGLLGLGCSAATARGGMGSPTTP